MTRRMQANEIVIRRNLALNPKWRRETSNHGQEHDENPSCGTEPRCEPVAEPRRRMQPNETMLRGHYVEHDENPSCARDPKCEPVAARAVGIAVPATGIVLVVDGVVQDVKPDDVDVMRHQLRPTGGEVVVDYRIRVRGKPTFFEEGKTYARASGHRFEVHQVKENGNGSLTAFGLITWLGGSTEWVTRKYFEEWEEVE